MNERRYLDIVSGRAQGITAATARAGLSLLTPFYRTVLGVRNRLFDWSLVGSHPAGRPVISVGNLTTGGTGKTPVVAWLANWLSSQGRRPAILSRGYHALDGETNDEFRVLQQLCPDVPHVQDRDRVAAARRLVAEQSPDVILLDDGFQHRRLDRDLDLVLIDALNPWGYGRMLPRGLLREPRSSLQRADGVLITRADQVAPADREQLRDEIGRWTPVPITELAFRPQYLMGLDETIVPLDSLNREPLLGFCGIGNPEGFASTLKAAGLGKVPVEAFPDHHHYTAEDLSRLVSIARGRGVSTLLTTQKDLVKLQPTWCEGVDLWAVVIGAEAIAYGDSLEQLLNRVC